MITILVTVSGESDIASVLLHLDERHIEAIREARQFLHTMKVKRGGYGSVNLNIPFAVEAIGYVDDLPGFPDAAQDLHCLEHGGMVLDPGADWLAKIPESAKQRTECDGLLVHDDSIRFTAYPKHSDDKIESFDFQELITHLI